MNDEGSGHENSFSTSATSEQDVSTRAGAHRELAVHQSSQQGELPALGNATLAKPTTAMMGPPQWFTPQPLHKTNLNQSGGVGAHSSLPPGYMLQHQGLADGKLKPGWFALTSHLSHS